MINYRAFTAKYIPQTNSRGAMFRITDLRNDKKVNVSIFSTDLDDASDVANEYLTALGIDIVGRSENLRDGYILFSRNFNIELR